MKKNKQKTSKLLGICCTAVALFMLSSVNIFAKSSGCVPTSSNIQRVACDSFRVGGDKFTQTGNYVIHLLNSEGCDSTVNLELTINNAPSVPMLVTTSVCGEGVDTLSVRIVSPERLSSPGNFYTWYDAAIDGNVVGTGEQFITPSLTQTTTYFATLTYMGCESARAGVEATVNFIPSAPYIPTPSPVCDSSKFSLSALVPTRANCRQCGDFNNYVWRDENDNIVSTDADFTTPMLYYSTNYNVTASLNGCTSSVAVVPITINHVATPSVLDSVICDGGVSKLFIDKTPPVRLSGCSNCQLTYTWKDENNTVVGTGEVFHTPFITENTTYFVQASQYGCVSEKVEVVANVVASPKITRSPISATVCDGEYIGFGVKATGYGLQYGFAFYYQGVIYNQGVTSDTVGDVVTAEYNGLGILFFAHNACGTDTSHVAYFNVLSPIDNGIALNDLTLSASATGIEYQWINCDDKSVIDGEISQSFSPTKSGNYAVIVSDPNSCNKIDTSDCVNVFGSLTITA